jgi:hypothetical protein
MSRLVNDGSKETPKLRVYLNLGSLTDLPSGSIWPGLQGLARDGRLLADGFEGVQLIHDEAPVVGSPLSSCGLDRINLPAEAGPIAGKHADRGEVCITVHAGWGLEDDEEVCRLVEAILTASDRHRLPIFLETHRATITQDLWRTVQITKRFPEVRFNGDFSHYYCGQELVYGDWATKLAFMEPIFTRVGFLHGRIASPGCMQIAIDKEIDAERAHGASDSLAHFKELWTRAMIGFLRRAGPGDVLIFAPELLGPANFYARMFRNAAGEFTEESDRYAQALLYQQLARSCFVDARSHTDGAAYR